MAGGSFSGFFNSGKNESQFSNPDLSFTSNTNFLGIDLSPNIGWFISGKMAAGMRLTGGYLYEKYIDTETGITFRKKENTSSSFTLGGFVRNYFSTSGSFYPFAQVNLDAGILSSTSEGFNYTTIYKETFKGKSSGGFIGKAGLLAGATRMLNPHVGIDLFAGYTFTHTKIKVKTITNRDIDFDGDNDETATETVTNTSNNHGFTIGVGFQVFLTRNKK